MNIARPEDTEDIKHHLAVWCALQIGLPRVWEHCKVLAVFDGDTLIAVVVYHDWCPETGVIELSAAATSKRWLTRKVLHEIFAYPFERLEYQMVVARVSPDNQTENGRGTTRIFRSFGFDEYRIPRLRGRDEDEIIFTLTDDKWRSKTMEKACGESAKAA